MHMAAPTEIMKQKEQDLKITEVLLVAIAPTELILEIGPTLPE